ncbi:unnamed protein product [Acanthoscelides obtectus]|uniref:Regulatory protein zeste n=1 Tax=Acanthoscelides obtectus TaxID=200917 RepID=A0A9P0Q3X2_ACAOB|nr:unnamed protein product [Acanthoscelides obtectus]CAK1689126.1 hypothetical protein AOBTE_LOCUS37022 [Acanthoscelides obtectus]
MFVPIKIQTNFIFNKQKNECWEKLAWEYNSIQTTGLRTGQQLKSWYEQMKKIAKQHKSEDKMNLLQTGRRDIYSSNHHIR